MKYPLVENQSLTCNLALELTIISFGLFDSKLSGSLAACI